MHCPWWTLTWPPDSAMNPSDSAVTTGDKAAPEPEEPQYIRARVANACDGCKARKGEKLPLALLLLSSSACSDLCPLPWPVSRLNLKDLPACPAPLGLHCAYYPPRLTGSLAVLETALPFHLSELMPLFLQSSVTASCRAVTAPVVSGLTLANTRLRGSAVTPGRETSPAHLACTHLLRPYMAAMITTAAPIRRRCWPQSMSMRASLPPSRPHRLVACRGPPRSQSP